jgi:hypothetical protein
VSYYRNEDTGYSEEYYEEPYYEDEGYYDRGYDVQPYDAYGYQDEGPRRSPALLTAALIIGVLACSCLSCALGIGVGLVAWEELNYTPSPAADEASFDMQSSPQEIANTWQTQDVVNTFVQAGLECENPQPLVNDGSLPVTAADSVQFIIPSLGPDYSARIFAFADPNKLTELYNYYNGRIQADLANFTWVFVKDNVLVQISGDLPDDWAGRYEAALSQM